MRALILAALLWAGVAGAQPIPAPAVSQIASNPSGVRAAAQVAPFTYSPCDPLYGGACDAVQGPAHFSVQGTKVAIEATMNFVVHASIASGSNVVTFTEAGAVPDLSGLPSNSYWINLPGAGGSGGTLYSPIVSTNPAANTITLQYNASTTVSNVSTTNIKTFLGNEVSANYTLAALDYEPVTVTGNTVVLGSAQMPTSADVLDFMPVCISGAGTAGGMYCGTITNQASDGKTFYVTPTPPTNISSGSFAVYWGLFLLSPDDATAGRKIELPYTGSGTNTLTGVQNATVSTIASVQSPLAATLSAAVSTNVYGKDGILTKGTDDWPAYQAAVNAAIKASVPNALELPQFLYFPRNSFNASITDHTLTTYMIQCGEGKVFWPQSVVFAHGTTSCFNSNRPSFPIKNRDLIPAVHLKQLTSLTAGSTATIAFVGDSQQLQGSNNAGYTGNMSEQICFAIKESYPDLKILCSYLAVGGTTFGQLDPNGPIYNGTTQGVPAAGNLATAPWYTDNTKPWLSYYVQNVSPDVIITDMTNNDGYGKLYGSMINVINYTQTATWKTNTGKNPDIILVADNPQPLNYSGQASSNFAGSIERGFARAGNYTLANGGKVGLIDFNRQSAIAIDGYDIDDMPQRRFWSLPGGVGSSNTSLPYTWNQPVQDFSWPFYLYFNSASPSQTGLWAALNNEVDFLLGGGANATPYSVTGGASIGYPGPYFRLYYNTGSGYLEYQIDTIYFQTAAVCSGTTGTSTLTCSAAVANIGHQNLSITVPGGGAAGATLTTTVNTVSADGKTVTLNTTLGTSVTNAALAIFRTQIPRKASRIAITQTQGAGGCRVAAGAFAAQFFLLEVKGNHVSLNYCGITSNGIDEILERPTTPFQPQVFSPAGSPGSIRLQFYNGGVINGAASSQMFASGSNSPLYLPWVRESPDGFGLCGIGNIQPVGANSVYGGTCSSHSNNALAALIRAPVINSITWR